MEHGLYIYIYIDLSYISSDFVNGGEMFTHLYQREHFTESEVRIYIGEITLALETLHKVSFRFSYWPWFHTFAQVLHDKTAFDILRRCYQTGNKTNNFVLAYSPVCHRLPHIS